MAGFELSKDDQDFINKIDARFPGRRIAENFADFLERDARMRPLIAAFKMNFVDREGWNEIGVKPRVQSLQNHVETMLAMLHHLTQDDLDAKHIAAMIEIHDIQETVTSDFTWDDDITKDEKLRIERLAINIIFENHPEKIALWEEYAAKQTPAAKWANDIDKLETVYEAETLEEKNPDIRHLVIQFKKNTKDALKTDQGLRIFNHLMETADLGVALGKKSMRITETADFLRHTPG